MTRGRHRITEQIARQQYIAARKRGWLPFILEAAETYNLLPEDILAIASRETNLWDKFLRIAGDHGNGLGLMQVDRRYHRAWVNSGKWRDARECFLKGAEILRSNMDWLVANGGRRVTSQDSKGNTRTYILPVFSQTLIRRVAIGMYNGGTWVASNAAYNKPIDISTTNKDYSEDVLERAIWFDALLDNDIAAGLVENSPLVSVATDVDSRQLPGVNQYEQGAGSKPANLQEAAQTDSPSTPAFQSDQEQGQIAKQIQSVQLDNSGTIATTTGVPLDVSRGERPIQAALGGISLTTIIESAKGFFVENSLPITLIVIAAVLVGIYIICNTFMNYKRVDIASRQDRLNVR
jgi:hypothetical protein